MLDMLRACGIVLILSFVYSTVTYAQPLRGSDSLAPQLSPAALRIAAPELANDNSWGPLFELPELTDSDKARLGFARLGEKVNHIQIETARTVNSTRYAQGAIRAGINVASVAGGPASVAGVAIWSEVLNVSFENTLEEIRAEGEQRAAFVLKQELRGDGSAQLHASLDELRDLGGDKQFDRAVTHTQNLRDELLAEIEDADARKQAEPYITASLAETAIGLAEQERADRIAADGAIQTDVTKNRQALIGLSRTLGEYASESEKRFTAIAERQQKIESGMRAIGRRVDDVDARLTDLSGDVGFLTEFAFARMTPQEQISALERGMGSLDPDARAERIKKLELVRDRQAFQKDAAEWLNGANLLIELAGKFDVDPDFLKDAQEAANLATTGFNAYKSFLEGGFTGYVGAANVIMSAFGSKADAEQARFEAIMNQLSALRKGQQEILKNQQALINGQKEILQGQKLILGRIDSLAMDMQKNFGRVFDELATIQTNQRVILDAVEALLNASINEPCGIAMNDDQISAYSASTREYLIHTATAFNDCFEGLRGAFASWVGGKPYFVTQEIATLKKATSSFNQNQYAPLRTVLDTISNGQEEKTFASLLSVSDRVIGIERPTNSISSPDRDAYLILPADIRPLPASALFVDNLLHRVEQLHWAYPMVELYDPGSKVVYTPAQMKEKTSANKNGLIALKNALRWIDIGIAQESLIAGSIVIPHFEKLLRGGVMDSVSVEEIAALQGRDARCGTWEPKQRATAALCILSTNSLLAQNFLVYALGKDLQANSASLSAYAVARGRTADDYELRQLIGERWELHWSPFSDTCDRAIEGWAVEIGLRCFVLPKADTMHRATMRYRSEMDRLLVWKSILVKSIAAFDLPSMLPAEENRLLTTILLRAGQRSSMATPPAEVRLQ